MTKYFQCDMKQGTTRTSGYIEERGARVGSLVEVKDELFQGLWEVISVADKGVEETVLREQQKLKRNVFQSIPERTGY